MNPRTRYWIVHWLDALTWPASLVLKGIRTTVRTRIADAKRGESVPSAPIAWDSRVFVGNAGGDYKGAKGHMYALEAKTGKIVWEFFLVPRAEGDVTRGPRCQRAVAQRFLSAQDRGMLRPGELQTVQQAILDRVHY
jgi:PQQ enzyme repeat